MVCPSGSQAIDQMRRFRFEFLHNTVDKMMITSSVVDSDLDLDAGLNADRGDLLDNFSWGVQVDQALVDPVVHEEGREMNSRDAL